MSLLSQYLLDVQALADHREAQLKLATEPKHKDILWQIYAKDVSSMRRRYFEGQGTEMEKGKDTVKTPFIRKSMTTLTRKQIRTSPPASEATVHLRSTSTDHTNLNIFGKVLAEAKGDGVTVVTYAEVTEAKRLREAIATGNIGWELVTEKGKDDSKLTEAAVESHDVVDALSESK